MDGSRTPKLNDVTEDWSAEQIRQSIPLEQRREIAADKQTDPETLALLASDKDAEVRKGVAGNSAAPPQVSPILAGDEVMEVRLILSHRLMRMLPDISPKEHKKLFDLTLIALTELATDQAVKVRIAMANALKDYDRAPEILIRELAVDLEREVAGPILKMADVLSDEDLLRIIATHSETWRLKAIAGRKSVSSDVAEAVAEKKDADATKTLLDNEGAIITDKTLKFAAEAMADDPQLKRMILKRRSLPARLATQFNDLAGQVTRNLLGKRRDLVDRRTAETVSLAVDRRMKLANSRPEKATPSERAAKLAKSGMLDEHVILDALSVGDSDFAAAALAELAKVELQVVERILHTRAGRPVVALCWQARISARCAFDIQARLAHVPTQSLLSPKGGTQYPLSREDMVFQLEMFEIEPRQ